MSLRDKRQIYDLAQQEIDRVLTDEEYAIYHAGYVEGRLEAIQHSMELMSNMTSVDYGRIRTAVQLGMDDSRNSCG